MVAIPSNIPSGVSDYTAALLRLLPKGSVWPTITDYLTNTFVRVLAGLADEPERIDSTIKQVFLEAIFPDSSDTTFLADWERLLGLPLVSAEQIDTKRRQMVNAMFNLSELSNEEFFINLASLCGYTINITYDVTVPVYFKVSDATAHVTGELDSVGQPLRTGAYVSILTWQVHVTAIPTGGSFSEICAVIQRYQPCFCDVTFVDET